LDLVDLAPDVILANGRRRAVTPGTRRILLVFVSVVDPVGSGFVASLAKPGGNATGFINFEHSTTTAHGHVEAVISPRRL